MAIFNKVTTTPSSSGPTAVTIIANGNRFVGDIEVTGQLQVDGLMEGSIRAEDTMTIGSQGSINGRIHGHLVQVAGHFEGEIWCDDLVIFPSGEVAGQVHCRQMVVENGGSFIGQRDQWSAESEDSHADEQQSSILLASIDALE